MEDSSTIYFTGTAGAGKTHLVTAFGSWLKSAGYDPIIVNLDPGNESTDLDPDIDIREWVRLPEVMEEYKLGPNGGQVAAADMIALKIFEIRQAVAELKADYVLVDTPGQVELFAFRESSKAIVDALSGDRSAIAFLFDPSLARSASGFVSLLLLSATVEFRFRLPMLNLLSKSDVLTAEQLEEITAWGDDPERLLDAVTRDSPTPDVQLSTEMLRAISTLSPLTTLLPTSSKDGRGLEALYQSLQRGFAGGDDLEASQAPPEGE
ncbi:MAG: ATP/GTP-binding protein [Thermoplasmata archaeon]|nr:ATP/GTP-binding protein [Thermoplasmata archaeon]